MSEMPVPYSGFAIHRRTPSTRGDYSMLEILVLKGGDGLEAARTFWLRHQWHPAADFESVKLTLSRGCDDTALYVFAVRREGDIKAILIARTEKYSLAIKVGYLKLHRIPARRMVLIDGGFLDPTGGTHWTGLLKEAVRQMASTECDYLEIENLPYGTKKHREAVGQNKNFFLSEVDRPRLHWRMQIPAKWDDFLARKSKKRRYWLNRLPRVLDQKFPGWQIRRFQTLSDAQKFADEAESISSKTYHRGIGGGFVKNEASAERLRIEANRGDLRGYTLSVDGEAVAFWYCFRYSDTLYLVSTGYLPTFREFEVGTVLLLQVIKDHCGTDLKWIDFGLGDAEYKERYGTHKFSEVSIRIFPATLRGCAIRIMLFVAFALDAFLRGLLKLLGCEQRVKSIWRRMRVKNYASEVG